LGGELAYSSGRWLARRAVPQRLAGPGPLAILAGYSLSISIRSQDCCSFSSPAAHVGKHSSGTSGPAGGSPVLGRYSPDGVGKGLAQPITVSMHPSNISIRIFQFLVPYRRSGASGRSIRVFLGAHRSIVGPLGPYP